jgi:hypothetical protein
MKSFLQRLLVTLALSFILCCFLIAYPFFIAVYLVTGKDLTAKLDNYVEKQKRDLF